MTDNFKSASGDAKSMKEDIKATANKASDKAAAQAHDVMEKVTAEAADYADGAKKAVSDEVKGVASALRTAADELRSGSAQERTFSQIADGLADASDAMRDKDLGELVTAASDFAKRNPTAFLGGAILLGFAATRFAKASSKTADTPTTRPSYQSSAPRAAGGSHWEGSKP